MNRHSLLIVALLILATRVAVAETTEKDPLIPDTTSNRDRPTDMSAGAFGFIVDDSKHEQDFADALEKFREAKHGDAAEQLARVTSYLDIERGRSTREGAKILREAAAELKKTESDLTKHKALAVENLTRLFAKTDFVLAQHHYALAARDWHDADPESNPGIDIEYAAADLATVYAWLSEAPPVGVAAKLDRARAAGEGLTGNVSYRPAAIDSALTAIDSTLASLKSRFAS